MDDPNEKITFIDTVLGLMKRKNVDIYVTGSNSKMLSREVLTQFRDRGDEIHVFPLSFREFLAAYEEIHASGNFMGGTRKKMRGGTTVFMEVCRTCFRSRQRKKRAGT